MKHRISTPTPQQTGFTLIELMITVAIIALLVAVVLPTYKEQIAKGRRADAKTQILTAQQWLERIYSESYNYSSDVAGTTTSTLFASQPFSRSPRLGDNGNTVYALSISTQTNSYTITATRTGASVGDVCGDLTMDNTNTKGLVNYSTTKYSNLPTAIAACWN